MSAQEEQDRFAEIMREHQRAHEFARLLSIEVDQLRAEVTRLTQEIEILEQVLKEEREEVKHHIEENERLKAETIAFRTRSQAGLCCCHGCMEKHFTAFPMAVTNSE